MSEPAWLLRSFVLAAHGDLTARFGGAAGIRDEGRLEAILARPRQAYVYGVSELHDLAASYAAGFILGHPFLDGNKRIGFVSSVVFLEINGRTVTVPETEAVLKTLALAAGELSEVQYAEWLRSGSAETDS